MMGASSPSERWCSSPPTPVTPGCWRRQTNSPPDSPPAEIRCRCTSKKPKPVTPSAGKDTTESRARCSSMKTPARTVSSLSRATRYSNSFALSTKRIATSCNGVAFKFQICLARLEQLHGGMAGGLEAARQGLRLCDPVVEVTLVERILQLLRRTLYHRNRRGQMVGL